MKRHRSNKSIDANNGEHDEDEQQKMKDEEKRIKSEKKKEKKTSRSTTTASAFIPPNKVGKDIMYDKFAPAYDAIMNDHDCSALKTFLVNLVCELKENTNCKHYHRENQNQPPVGEAAAKNENKEGTRNGNTYNSMSFSSSSSFCCCDFTLLDLGCGSGRISCMLLDHVTNIFAYDRSSAMIARCKENLVSESRAPRKEEEKNGKKTSTTTDTTAVVAISSRSGTHEGDLNFKQQQQQQQQRDRGGDKKEKKESAEEGKKDDQYFIAGTCLSTWGDWGDLFNGFIELEFLEDAALTRTIGHHVEAEQLVNKAPMTVPVMASDGSACICSSPPSSCRCSPRRHVSVLAQVLPFEDMQTMGKVLLKDNTADDFLKRFTSIPTPSSSSSAAAAGGGGCGVPVICCKTEPEKETKHEPFPCPAAQCPVSQLRPALASTCSRHGNCHGKNCGTSALFHPFAQLAVFAWSLSSVMNAQWGGERWHRSIDETLAPVYASMDPNRPAAIVVVETLGTNTETPRRQSTLHSYLEDQHGFVREAWCRTDYIFSSFEDGERKVLFFFGSDMQKKFRENYFTSHGHNKDEVIIPVSNAEKKIEMKSERRRKYVLPECTGIWVKRMVAGGER